MKLVKQFGYLGVLLVGLISISSCVNQELNDIRLQTYTTANFSTNSSPTISDDSVLTATNITYDLEQRLLLANINESQIQSIRAENVTLTLNEPADSTFAILDSAYLFLIDGLDSLQIAVTSPFITNTSRSLELRPLGSDARSYLFNPANVEINLFYQLNTDSVQELDIDLEIDWVVEGEVE